MNHDNNLDLSGLSNRPIPWRVYEFFYQGGGRIGATPMGIIAAFVEESDAQTFAKERTTDRIYFRIIHQDAIRAAVSRL